jgi:hypothetical protein
MRDRCAVPRTLFQCVCTQHRNRIGRLSPFSEYAPTASRFKLNSFATIKLVQSPLDARKPPVRAWLLRVRWYSRRQLALLDLARALGVVSWFEFIDFRCDIVVVSLFGGHQFLGKAAPKITLRCFHQPGHQIFRHSVDRSILIDFGLRG